MKEIIKCTEVEITTRTFNYNTLKGKIKYRLWKIARNIVSWMWRKLSCSRWRFYTDSKFKDVYYYKITKDNGDLTFLGPIVSAPLYEMDDNFDDTNFTLKKLND